MSNSIQLVIKKGPGPGQSFELEKDEIVIGRDIHSDIAIIDSQISRGHAKLTKHGETYSLEDLGSTNHTFLNKVKLTKPQLLKDGDLIGLGGNVVLAFEVFANVEEASAQMSRAVLSTSVNLPTGLQSQLFISYSRKDKEFVQKLHASLIRSGAKAWVDWEGIPLSADWWAEIQTAIEGSDAFVYVISPDSLNSEVCGRELEAAVKHNKRLIPVLFRDPNKGDKMHEKVSSHNWIYMRDDGEYRKNLSPMLHTINTDLEWVRAHTRLLERAVEWDRAARDASFLLRGTDLGHAGRMIAQVEKAPALTGLQLEYIQAGQKLQGEERQKELEIAQTLKEQAEARERAEKERIATFWRSVTRITLLIGFFACGYTFNIIAGISYKLTSGSLSTATEELAIEIYTTVILATVAPGLIGAIGAWHGFRLYQWRNKKKQEIESLQYIPADQLGAAAEGVRTGMRRPFVAGVLFLGFFLLCSAISSVVSSYAIYAAGGVFLSIIFLSALLGSAVAGFVLWWTRRGERKEVRARQRAQTNEDTRTSAPQVAKLFLELQNSSAVLAMLGMATILTYFGITLYSHTRDAATSLFLPILMAGPGALGLLAARVVLWALGKALPAMKKAELEQPTDTLPGADASLARYKTRAYLYAGFFIGVLAISILIPYPLTVLEVAKYLGVMFIGLALGVFLAAVLNTSRRLNNGRTRGSTERTPVDKAQAKATTAFWASLMGVVALAAILAYEDSGTIWQLALLILPGTIGAGTGWLVDKMVN